MTHSLETWPQYRNRMIREIASDYDISKAEAKRETAWSVYFTDWHNTTIAWLRKHTPTARQWRSIVRDINTDTLWRRLFHDEPGAAERYVQAGLFLPQTIQS